ncbi:CDP-alcohol phosphatidyltransferase family protein [Rudaea sp.]|uniref:CDP-alcohol phosphatidyltransferase family protein n=1 Tax=Rudaea sp. TaxID=2136325 RepID=UPI00321FFCB2
MPTAARMPPTPNRDSPWRHLPNAITLARIVLVVPLVWLIANHRFEAALVVVAVAGASDALDGLLAKRYGWQSWLGGVLDPLADKLLLIACFVSLDLAGVIPDWLMWLVVGRDLVIAAGATAYHFLIGRVLPQPSALSKVTTFVQIVCALALLLKLSGLLPLADVIDDALIWLTALTTTASGMHYVAVWSHKALEARRRGNA